MAIRQLTVWPDEVRATPNGDVACVSAQAFLAALVEIGSIVPVAGGSLAVAVDRQATGMPNESVTVLAVMEWRNHSAAKPQPEPHVESEPVEDEPAEEPALVEEPALA